MLDQVNKLKSLKPKLAANSKFGEKNSWYLAGKIPCEDLNVIINQSCYVKHLVKHYDNDNIKCHNTPMHTGLVFTKDDLPKTEEEHATVRLKDGELD